MYCYAFQVHFGGGALLVVMNFQSVPRGSQVCGRKEKLAGDYHANSCQGAVNKINNKGYISFYLFPSELDLDLPLVAA